MNIAEKLSIRAIDGNKLQSLFLPCHDCLYWESPDASSSPDQAFAVKQSWFEATSRVFSPCGMLLQVDGKVCGYTQFAPPDSFDNAQAYALSLFPTSPDAILLTCLFIQKEFRGQGLGVALLQAVLLNLQQRGYSALESYGRDDSANNCSGPTQFLVHQGFHPVRQGIWEGISFTLVRLNLTP